MPLWQPGMRITASRLQAAGPWVPLTTLGAYQGGASDGSAQPMARDLYVRDEVVRQFKGIINLSGVGTSSYTFFTFSAAYRPDYERDWGVAGIPNAASFRCFLSTAGNWGVTGQASGLTSIRLDEYQIMSAPGLIPS
jgi:hypothetical protein